MLGIRSEWGRFADDVGGTYKARDNGSGEGMRVTVQSGPWKIVLSRFTRNQDPLYTPHTVGTACYVATGTLRFTINRETALSRAEHLLGLHDVRVGDDTFDAAFSVRANDPEKVRELLSDAELRRLLLDQPAMHLTIFDDEGLVTRNFRTDADAIFSDARDDTIKKPGVDELYFHIREHVEEYDRLKGLCDIFALTLHRLLAIGAATDADPTTV